MATSFQQQSVLDISGRGRLEFHLVKLQSGGFDFHSLRWIRGARCLHYITKNQFEGGRGRWVAGLHSIDAVEGTAIIRVAEYERATKPRRVIYSWREWDLINNVEVRYLQTCETPFDEYDPVDA